MNEIEMIWEIGTKAGPLGAVAAFLMWQSMREKKRPSTDPGADLIKQITQLNDHMADLRERVARIEGKLSQ